MALVENYRLQEPLPGTVYLGIAFINVLEGCYREKVTYGDPSHRF